MLKIGWLFVVVVSGFSLMAGHFDIQDGKSLPLNVKILDKSEENNVKIETFEFDSRIVDGETYRIYAIMAVPAKSGNYPVMLHLHGGGQGADKDIVRRWAERGYAAVTFDWTGNMDGKVAGRRPFSDFGKNTTRNNNNAMFPTDGADSRVRDIIIAARRLLLYLKERPECDRKQIAVTGISWGGFCGMLLAGIEPEIKAVSSVYGCGFFKNAVRLTGPLVYCPDNYRKFWLETYDPSNYFSQYRAATLMMTGSNDIFFHMNQVVQTYEALTGPKHLIIVPNINHSFGNQFIEQQSAAWFDDVLLKKEKKLPAIIRFETADGAVKGQAFVPSGSELDARLNYTWLPKPQAWNERVKYLDARGEFINDFFLVKLPDEAPSSETKELGYYVTLSTPNGLLASSILYGASVSKVKSGRVVDFGDNLFVDPSFAKQTKSGKNGPIYINAVGGFAFIPDGIAAEGKKAVLLDQNHHFVMQAPSFSSGGKIRYAVSARLWEERGNLKFQINFMNNDKLITAKTRIFKVESNVFSSFVMEESIPENCTKMFLYLQGDNCAVTDLYFGEIVK